MEDSNTKIDDSEKDKTNINIESFIKQIPKKLEINKKIHIVSKILNKTTELRDEEKIIYFLFKIYKNTDINPFTSDIIIDMELNHNKTPYIRIRTDFILPSMYDNRNYFYCLTKEHNFIYDCCELDKLENVLKDIINNGIENFLCCLKENIAVNSFIYYGEYKVNEVYNMNDFLENNKLIKIYRIKQVLEKGKGIEEKYIVLTQLYFLIFKPLEADKTLAKLKFIKTLKNICFNYKKSFSKKLNENTFILYIQDIKTPNGITFEIEFAFIDRSRPPIVKKDDEEEEEENENENEKDKKEKDKNENTANNINNNNNTNDVWDKYYKFEEEIERKQKEINYGKFKLIMESYKPFFEHRSIEENSLSGMIFKNTIMNYEKMFQHCEKVYNYYVGLKDNKKYKKRMDFYIININFFCAELMRFFDLERTNFQFYYDKMRYYLDLNEKNQ
jgi:hypothetical protein